MANNRTIESQRDIRWDSKKLGYSNTTIGRYGCTITCISYLANTTPDVANDKLKKVKGFTNNLVIWSKIHEAFPELEYAHRIYS